MVEKCLHPKKGHTWKAQLKLGYTRFSSENLKHIKTSLSCPSSPLQMAYSNTAPSARPSPAGTSPSPKFRLPDRSPTSWSSTAPTNPSCSLTAIARRAKQTRPSKRYHRQRQANPAEIAAAQKANSPQSAMAPTPLQSQGLAGTALVHENEVIHAAFFRPDEPSTPKPSRSFVAESPPALH